MCSQNVKEYEKNFRSNYENCIYRYRSFDSNGNNISALEKNRLYFSTPVNFNDPFDNLIYANLGLIVNHFSNDVNSYMDTYLTKSCNNPTIDLQKTNI